MTQYCHTLFFFAVVALSGGVSLELSGSGCEAIEEWSAWSECSTTDECGNGTQTRTRRIKRYADATKDDHCPEGFQRQSCASPCYWFKLSPRTGNEIVSVKDQGEW